MKISIALCTYKGEKFLTEQLESFLCQSILPDELIVCDDLSNDATVDILKDFANKAPFKVKIFINEKNLGSTKNFEKAISYCTGEIIFLADQDDIWFEDKVKEIIEIFEQKSEVGLVFSNAQIINENGLVIHKDLLAKTFGNDERNLDFFEILIRQNVITGATLAFRSKFKSDILPIPTYFADLIHDGWISLVIASKSKVYMIEKPLIKYRKHENQQVGVGLEQESKNRQERFSNAIEQRNFEINHLLKIKKAMLSSKIFREKYEEISKIVESSIAEKNTRIEHLKSRKNLPKNRLKRISKVFNELKTKRYHKFSNGLKSAAKDLIETL
jgi:glycosyltransferase involved in cell wall biosynthesis